MTAHKKASLAVCGLAAVVLAIPAHLGAQDAPESLTAARQLYASAEYGGALTMLNGLLATNPSGQERQSIDLYRTLCLVAVGNAAEANRIIETMISKDPLYRPANEDVPPRLRSAFSETRRRLLPSIIQQKYLVAKAAYDQQDFSAAAEGFKQVLNGLSDPDIAPVTEQPPLSDLRVLATGFHDLTSKASAPLPAAAAVPVTPEAPVDRVPRIYSSSDAAVVPPTVIRQVMPPYPGRVLVGGVATIDVLIDDRGTVEAASMETSFNPHTTGLPLSPLDRGCINQPR